MTNVKKIILIMTIIFFKISRESVRKKKERRKLGKKIGKTEDIGERK